MRSLQLFSYLTAILLCLGSTSFAQETLVKNSKANYVTSYFTNVSATAEAGTAIVQPNIKMQQVFLKQFPNATKIEWRQLTKNYYISFLNRDQKASTVLTPKGIIKYTVTNCTLKQLPAALQNKIAKHYAGYAFVSATQIDAYDAVAHEVILENDKDYITLKATEDGVEEKQNIRKTIIE